MARALQMPTGDLLDLNRSPLARLVLMAVLTAVLLVTGCGRDEKKPDEVASIPPPVTKPTRDEQRRFDDLTIDFIMQGPGLTGTSPSGVAWSADGGRVYFEWNDPHKLDSLNAIAPDKAYDNYLDLRDEKGHYVLDVESGEIAKLSDEAADTLVPDDGAWNTVRTRRAEIRSGDLYLVDLERGRTRRITATLAREHGVVVSRDGSTVYFIRDDNLYVLPWSGTPIRQLTNLELDDEPSDKDPSPQREFLIDQQKELFAQFKREPREPRERRPKPVYLGSGWTIEDIQVSPSGHFAAVELARRARAPQRPLVPHFVTESGYMETRETRPKVGDNDGVETIRLVDLRGDSLLPIALDDEMIVDVVSWSPKADVLLARGITNDFKSRHFYAVTPGGGAAGSDSTLTPRDLDVYDDTAWVGGPGFYSTGGWVPDGSAIYFVSEEDGFSHLFTVSIEGAVRKQLTRGDWEVYAAHPSRDGTRWYLTTNEAEPGSHRLWVMNRDGGSRRILTPDVGRYDANFAGDERRIAFLHSTLISPPELHVFDLQSEKLSEPLTVSTTELFRSYPWIWPEVVNIKADDGGKFRAHVYKPKTFGARANQAGVVFIHGAGYLQNVMSWWTYYYREYMFNHMLAAKGYTVLNVDYRGSAGYGRECRTAIHRHMGGRDLDDVIDAARYLSREMGCDRDKIGVYGGSYGGFLTIMALFKYPGVINCGGAIRSVTDWAHYNHWYTSRILGLPEKDPEAYAQSSPINFAEGFQGGLLMLHGLVDDNVLAADVIRLSQHLIELGKEDWDLVLYPVEAHSFQNVSSWKHEYHRIFDLFEERLARR